MPRDGRTNLQVQAEGADAGLALQRTRFDTLVAEVARWRAELQAWKERVERFEQAVGPVRRELHGAWREWVFALDSASLQSELARRERVRLQEMLVETARALLDGHDDAEVAAVLRRHVEAAVLRPADVLPTGDEKHEAREDTAPEWEQEAEAAAARRAAWAAQRRASAGRRRDRQAAQEASQSVRDVYRRLASALHPDREPDAQERARKTALMQQANEAYAQGNLLVLLALQLQAEQFDAAQAATSDPRRLQHYMTVLQEQLADLKSEVRQIEADFRAAAGLPAGSGMQPRKADRLISSEVQRMRGELQLLRQQVGVLRDVEATKRWLREERRA